MSALKSFAKAVARVTAGLGSAAQDSAKKIGDALGKSGGIINDDVMKTIKKTDAGGYDVDDLGLLTQITRQAKENMKNLPTDSVRTNLKTVSEVADGIPAAKMVKATDSTVAETADALKKSNSFYKRNEKALLTAGISAAGLGMYMLMTGESDPAKAIGKVIGDVAGGVGTGLGSGFKGFLDSSGLGDMFKGWGTYILLFFAAILAIFGLYMFFG